MSTLEDVLSETRLTEYENNLKENGCELLSDLLDHESKNELINTLKDCGITKLMHRKRLANKVWSIKTSGSNANNNNNNNNNNNGNNNDNNRNNRNNGNRNNNYNDDNNNNNNDELSQIRRQMEAMRLRFEMERMQRDEDDRKRREDDRRRREEEEREEQQQQQRQENFSANFNLGQLLNNNNNNNNSSSNNNNNRNFGNNTFPITYDEGDNPYIKHGFSKTDNVKKLFKDYAKAQWQSDADNLLTRFELTYGNRRLNQNDWNTSLESIGMGSNRLGEVVGVIWHVNGGSKNIRKLRKNDGYDIVKGECCILKMEEECAKMDPCKHLISSYAMYMYIKTIIEKDVKAYQIICPVDKCNKLWNWDKCCSVGDLTQEEYMGYTAIARRRQKLSSGAFKNCPHCKVLIKRPEKLGKNRVSCSKCNKSDFCYICMQKWKVSGFALCGNEKCPLYEKQRKLLKCPKIKKDSQHSYEYYNTLDIPIYRACPKCYRFIKHTSACKHMNCPGCSLQFCFICLGIYENNKWPCMLNGQNTNYSLGCNLAPRQKLG